MLKTICTLLLATVLAASPTLAIGDDEETGPNQIGFAAVVLNGRTLTGPNTSAQRRNGRILVPVSAVARALGDVLVVDVGAKTVSVRRRDGIEAVFESTPGIVREAARPVLTISGQSEIVFTANADELLLPAEVFAALFAVSVRLDTVKNVVVISSGVIGSSVEQNAIERGAVELYSIDYEFGLNRFSSSTSHSLVMNGVGRLGDGRFHFSSATARSHRGLDLQNLSFMLERPNGQQFAAGDVGTGTDLPFMAGTVRGGLVSLPAFGMRLNAFGGKTFSGSVAPPEDLFTFRPRSKYDTTILGTSIATERKGGFNYAFGGLTFSSDSRSGSFGTAGVRYAGHKLRLDGDAAFGKFDGRDSRGETVSGTAAAFDVAANLQLADSLGVQGRVSRSGKEFLFPQAGYREPLDLVSAGVNWSPARWLSTAVTMVRSKRPGSDEAGERFGTGSFAITPRGQAPRIYLSHSQGSTSVLRRSEFSTLSATKEFSRLRLHLNATRTRNIGPATVNVQAGASYLISDHHAIEGGQGFGSRGSRNGHFDWRASGIAKGRVSFTAGVGYNYLPASGTTAFQRVAASVSLPRNTSLQFNLYNTPQGQAVTLSIRGSLFRRKGVDRYLGSVPSEMNSYGRIRGRVYQDVNLNGTFDEGVDKPQANAKVMVDGSRYVESDDQGYYSFDAIDAGERRVHIDLLSVRADLTLLDDASAKTRLLAGNEAARDFRLVKTARVTGRVWHDANGNGLFDEGETPLSDVRIVTASGRDTLTDMDGCFVIADLPPGEHVFAIDEKTLPDGKTAATKPVAVQAFAGRETSDVFFVIIDTPAEIKRFPSRQN